MTASDWLKADTAVARLSAAVTTVADLNVDRLDLDLDELATLWLQIDTAHRTLGVALDDWANNVGDKLSDMPYERRDGYRLPNGERIHHASRSTDRWQGRRLLADLSTQLVDPDTGEHLPAIPTVVLEQIVPGTAKDELTSSRWSTTGLHNLGVDPDMYRRREWKPPRAGRGPGR